MLLHGAATWIVFVLPVRHADPTPSAESHDDVTIDLLPGEAKQIESPTPLERDDQAKTSPSAVARAEHVPSTAAPVGEPRGVVTETAPGAEREPSSAPIALGPSVAPNIGIGGPNPFLPRSEAAVDAAEAKRAASETLKEAARARDRALGLGPEGPVLTALAEGTGESIAPVRGRAVFVATSDATGEVVSLDLLDAEGGRPGWADAARIAFAKLKGKKLRVAPGTTRSVMKIEVKSAWKLPSGQDPGTDVELFGVQVAKGEGKDSPKMRILNPIPKISMDYLELGPGVQIPVPTIRIEIFTATADPTNLGATPRRVIHTHVLESSAM